MAKSDWGAYVARGSARRPAARERVAVAPPAPALEGAEIDALMQQRFGLVDPNYDEWQSPIRGTKHERTMDDYIDGSEQMNGYLRTDRSMDKAANVASLDRRMQDMFNEAGTILDRDIVVYRGVRSSAARVIDSSAEIQDKGYTSTSTRMLIAKGFTGFDNQGKVYKIRVPKGTRVAMFGGYESEIVLNKGGRYKVEQDGSLTLLGG